MALASGATFAGYMVARRLGAGMTGEVYLVQDRRSARWAALKILSRAWSSDSEFRGRFHWETAIAANLRHPHVIEVFDRGEFNDQLWIAMSYVEGISAAQLMADRFPAVSPVDEVLAILTAAAEALDEAHHRGLLHRDVKPANIVLTGREAGEQRVLLTDFGLARRGGASEAAPDGPAGYAAPEQLAGGQLDERADQYALAATAFHLLTGAPPVHETGAAPPLLSDQRPELARLDEVFSRALATDPADRFPSCGAFADAATEHGGVSVGDHNPESAAAAEYLTWPDLDDLSDRSAANLQPAAWRKEATGATKRPAPKAVTPRPTDSSASTVDTAGGSGGRRPVVPSRRRPRRLVLAAGAVVVVAALAVVAFLVARKFDLNADRDPSAPASTPLDGTYRLQVDRSKQTFNETPDPQPPDANSWWAFRSSCTPSACSAAAVQLDDGDHSRVKTPDAQPVLWDFRDGSWIARPTSGRVSCVGPAGAAGKQASSQVLTLHPQPSGDLTGQLTLTVQTNGCRQQGAVIRAPAVASRVGDVPPELQLPDPVTILATSSAPTTRTPHR
ncbi:serine/threonine protein kinase [Mycobacterium rhizamassiliense]|uniref:non-specific serine/threonine protein kinase n=1 Tax=Mycobacterium rhizamassiliense TaxID=1841860 RepID=A0A2U3P1G2_9MYCO|nr:serine/threonine-protein kinase [Mycobacterium rhizamassiliense]SPM37599.1 serine/threonine protein kinase [Mycobacterium rhizamassiliense]